MNNKIYRLKEDIDLNKLAELDWEVTQCNGGLVFLKFAVQPLDGHLTKELLNAYYNNPNWIKNFYQKNKKYYTEKLDLRYDKKGNIKKSKHFEKTLTHWIIEIEHYDLGWLCISPYDECNKNAFYGKDILDKYCAEEIEKLKEFDLIEEIEVGDE